MSRIKDFAKYPELRWLDRYWMVPPVAAGVIAFLIGGFFGARLGVRGAARCCAGTARSRSTRSRTCGAAAATRPTTTRATTSCSP